VAEARVSVLIVSYNTRDLLLEALGALSGADVELIVADNASADGSPDAVAQHFPSVRLALLPTNRGFAAGVNQAAALASGDVLLLLNPDAVLSADGAARLARFLTERPRAAAVGAALRYVDGRPQAAGFRFPGLVQVGLDLWPVGRLADSALNGRVPSNGRPVLIDHPLGACMAISRRAWNDVGPLDEGYFMYVEEVDWCRRARRRGWEIWQDPGVVAVHHAGAATRQQPEAMFVELWRSRLRYYERHASPLYNRVLHALLRVGFASQARGASPERRRALDRLRELIG
jgi:N-acetylglucosaminyl-diphospho-decaprenol L-rhamnosyltransferase